MALYDKASLVLIPSGTKAGTVYQPKACACTNRCRINREWRFF